MLIPLPSRLHGAACQLCGERGGDFLMGSKEGRFPVCAYCLEGMHYSLHQRQAERGIPWNQHRPECEISSTFCDLHNDLHHAGFIRKWE